MRRYGKFESIMRGRSSGFRDPDIYQTGDPAIGMQVADLFLTQVDLARVATV
jgi:hypothetical protein